MKMQQSGGLLPPGVSAGCSIVYSSPVARTREVIRTGNSVEVERIAVFADILLAFPDGLRYNKTVIRRKRKGTDITEKENGRNLK